MFRKLKFKKIVRESKFGVQVRATVEIHGFVP